MRSRRRGFSLMEVLATLTIMGVLGGIAAAGYSYARQSTIDSLAVRTLEAAVQAQQSYKQARGEYATSQAELDTLITQNGIAYSEADPSTWTNIVSVKPIIDPTGDDGVGMAVASEEGNCLVMRLYANGGSSVTTTMELPDTLPCDGNLVP